MAQQATDFTLDTAAELAELEPGAIEGRSPWYLAWRRLRRNYVALIALLVFVLIVFACAMAPWYAENVAETGPNRTHLTDKVEVDGELVGLLTELSGKFTQLLRQAGAWILCIPALVLEIAGEVLEPIRLPVGRFAHGTLLCDDRVLRVREEQDGHKERRRGQRRERR